MRNVPITLLSAADTASQTGNPAWVGFGVSASATIIFGDATAVGTVQLYGSNEAPTGDPVKYVPTAGSFNLITGAASTSVAGVAPAIVLATMNFQYIKAVYTRASGGSSTILVSMSYLGVS